MRVSRVGACTVTAVAVLIGCGGEEHVTAEVTATTTTTAPSDFRFSAKTPEGGEVGAQVGGDVALPADFPDDIPRYPGAKPAASFAAGAERGMLVTFETADPPAKVFAFYREGLGEEGWAIQTEGNYGGQGLLTANKDDRIASVIVTGGEGKTRILVTLGRRE